MKLFEMFTSSSTWTNVTGSSAEGRTSTMGSPIFTRYYGADFATFTAFAFMACAGSCSARLFRLACWYGIILKGQNKKVKRLMITQRDGFLNFPMWI